ncbi:sugar diacid recognition domain-containing protein [Eubacterium aggregans]|uniref:sugar diacid recognition domain-containing protein n=1 Tax=Eubacterium aggregans TaxID=81409 RepID=UPI003F2B5F6C
MDQRIAQRIADEVMSGLGYNINVMNAEGVIIGSGSKDRLGSFHETPLEVIRCGRVLEVTADQASALQGVREGINLPILDSRKQVIGVVGITVDPECVRNPGVCSKYWEAG